MDHKKELEEKLSKIGWAMRSIMRGTAHVLIDHNKEITDIIVHNDRIEIGKSHSFRFAFYFRACDILDDLERTVSICPKSDNQTVFINLYGNERE